MRIALTKPLFAWDCLDDRPSLGTIQWFGYKLHLIVDVKHEVALAWEITSATDSDANTLPNTLAQAEANLPENRIETLAFDKAADDNDTHKLLNQSGIKPLIEMRALWKEEPLRLLPGHDGNSNLVYDEKGTLYGYDRTSHPIVRHQMAYHGYEPQRGTLKYRCPARHEGWTCPHDAVCNDGKRYGLTVRVKSDIDLRRFPPVPRATKKFERLYDGRTAVERVNSRLKVFWGADDGNISGARLLPRLGRRGDGGPCLLRHAAGQGSTQGDSRQVALGAGSTGIGRSGSSREASQRSSARKSRHVGRPFAPRPSKPCSLTCCAPARRLKAGTPLTAATLALRAHHRPGPDGSRRDAVSPPPSRAVPPGSPTIDNTTASLASGLSLTA
jgi:hypothetical protein